MVLTLLVPTVSLTTSGAEDAPRHVALIVGISDYPSHGCLPSATNDAVQMARLALSRDFDEVILLLNATATRSRIAEALARLQRELHPEDQLTFFYSGHASREAGGDGNTQGYLVTHGCEQGQESQSGLEMDALARALAQLPNRYLTVMIDSCYSGMMAEAIQRQMGAVPPEQAVSNRVVAVLASTGVDKLAFESKGHGLMTRKLLAALATREDDAIMSRGPTSKILRELDRSISQETGGWQQPQVTHFGANPVSRAFSGF